MTNFDTIALFGQRFKNYRKALHISQQQLHKKTGVSLFTISSFENGKGQGISISHLLSLLNALDLGASFIDLIPEIPAIDPEKMWNKKR
jgi:toxin-antitoxin system, antitoxin component, xre family